MEGFSQEIIGTRSTVLGPIARPLLTSLHSIIHDSKAHGVDASPGPGRAQQSPSNTLSIRGIKVGV